MRRSEVYKSLLTDVFAKMYANNNIDDDFYNDVISVPLKWDELNN